MLQPENHSQRLVCLCSSLLLLPHVFCCFLPLILAMVGFFASSSLKLHYWLHNPIFVFIHQYHIWILATAIISVAFSVFLLLKQKKKSRRTITFVCFTFLLLILDISFFLLEENFFHVNHFRFQ